MASPNAYESARCVCAPGGQAVRLSAHPLGEGWGSPEANLEGIPPARDCTVALIKKNVERNDVVGWAIQAPISPGPQNLRLRGAAQLTGDHTRGAPTP